VVAAEVHDVLRVELRGAARAFDLEELGVQPVLFAAERHLRRGDAHERVTVAVAGLQPECAVEDAAVRDRL